MPHLREELERFHRFASQSLDKVEDDASLQELLDLYEIEFPSQKRHAEDVAAIRAAIRDMEQGDEGVPFEQFMREFKARNAESKA